MPSIDLRSDTVTHPTPAMREAMANAEVGDDVWGDDPTVNRLEGMSADMLGKEAAVFTPSGTMSNLISVLSHTQRGNEIILGSESHMFWNEVGGASALAGVQVRTVPNDEGGMMDPAAVEAAIRGQNIHFPPTALVAIENTHNRCSGAVLDTQDTAAIADVAHSHGIQVHLDGARIFNAAVCLETPVQEMARDADSVCFCLSKGLSAPVGSLLCGTQEFVEKARKWRKMVGGGMRQAGIIAAAGIVALESMVDRLAEDHATARKLARGLSQIPGISIDPDRVQTNIVIFEVTQGAALDVLRRMGERGVRGSYNAGSRIRFVTHYGISEEDVDTALEVVEAVMKESTRT